MSQGRKSSLDNVRRGAQKAHVPYRADDLTQGKKTGIAVKRVDRQSDGFESFGEVLNQADGVTPPHVRARRKGRRSLSPAVDYDDGNGEMSMELDDSNVDSPQMYLNRTRRPSAPTSANRSNASARLSNRSGLVDYDRVPSPRPSTSSQRIQSTVSTPADRHKSNLSRSAPPSPERYNQTYVNENDDGGGADFDGGDYDAPVQGSSSPARHASFTEMDQDDVDDIQPMAYGRSSSSPVLPSAKGKGRQELFTQERQVEDEIERGLQEIDEDEDEDEDEGQEEAPLSKGKRARVEETTKKPKLPAKKRKVQKQQPLIETDQNVDGLRRGTRERYRPLEYWRNEKVVYGRRNSGTCMVPVIKDIIRFPKETGEPLGTKKRTSKPRSKKKDDTAEQQIVIYNPEEGWDDATDPYGIVVDYNLQEEVQRRVAFTSKMVTTKPAANNDFLFQKIFGDGEFIAAGQLIIPVGGKKPNKGTKDNTYIFYLIEGAINLKIHRSSFVLATGGMFLIPRGNNYYLENISQRPAKLFFTQARKVTLEEADDAPGATPILRRPPPSQQTGNGGISNEGSRRSSSTASPDKVTDKAAVKKRSVSASK